MYKGDLVNWTIIITNNGPDDAVNTKVIDKLPNGLIYVSDDSNGDYNPETGIWTVQKLANGESRTLIIQTLVNITNATIKNVAVGTSDTYDPDESNNNGTNKTNVSPESDLEVIKIVSNKTVSNGDIVTWTIIIINHGPDDAVNVRTTDRLPLGLQYVGDNTNGAYDLQTGLWAVGNLKKGERRVIIIDTLVNATNTTIKNVAFGTSDIPDPDPSNNNDTNRTNVIPEADLEVIKQTSSTTAHKGDLINWTIIVINHGPDDAVNAKVTDKLPNGLVYVSDDANGAYDPETGIWTIGNLKNGARVTLVITTLVNITNTTIENVAIGTSDIPDPDPSNNNGTNKTNVMPEADLAITKEVTDIMYYINDTVVWTITLINNGPDCAVDTVVSEVLPDGLELINYTATKGTYTDGIWTVGNMESGESLTLVLNTKV